LAGPSVATAGFAGADEERRRLSAAIATAREEIERLAEREGGLGAEVLSFQVAMLEDPELSEEAFASIGREVPARVAWVRTLSRQADGYATAEDEYFRARAADLRDLRDRVLVALEGRRHEAPAFPPGAIVLDRDLSPSRFLALPWGELGGVALEAGSPFAHVAMLARARGVPMVTDLGEVPEAAEAILDGERGVLVAAPEPETRARYAALAASRAADEAAAAAARDRPAVTRAGERVEVMVNVDDPAAVDDAVLAASDGVGLLRTEFLFLGRDRLPDEAEQLAAYAALLDRLGGKPCIVRTLDVGGDKPLPGVSLPREANPFLGLRGLRLCLERPDLFRPQVRALLRAARGRPLKVMLPMVATAGELAEARALFAACLADLAAERVPAAMPPLGVMVETPAAAVAPDLLPADFYSIGSNDLTQYVLAAARDGEGRVARLLDPLHPAVLRLIAGVVRHGASAGVPVSLCGDAASDPAALPALLAHGLRRLSVAPAAVGRVKLAIGRFGDGGG
jgi:phosphotransferase system enzyme I (PtsI)